MYNRENTPFQNKGYKYYIKCSFEKRGRSNFSLHNSPTEVASSKIKRCCCIINSISELMSIKDCKKNE